MRLSVVAFLLVALAMVLAVTAESGWDRSSDPFMRLTRQIDSSLIENSAKATVARASRLARVSADDDDSEESSEDAAEESSEDAAEESSEDAAAAEESSEDAAAAEESSEDAAAAAEESSEDSKAGLEKTVEKDEKALADAKDKIDEANARADAAQNSASATTAAQDQKARAELEAVRAQAEAQAKQTIEAATAQAKDLLDRAKAKATDSCGDNCGKQSEDEKKKQKEYREVVLLKPSAAGSDPKIDQTKLGLAPVMTVDTPTIRHAEVVAKKAEDFHDKFIDKHEKDCAGSVCPTLNFRVGAQ